MTNMYCGKLFLHAAFKPNVLTTPISLHKETDKKWSRVEQLYNPPKQTFNYFENDRKFHISVYFPNEEDQVWGIEWSAWRTATQSEIYGFTTTIPHGKIPDNEQELCENFLKYLHRKWKDICSDEDVRLKHIVSYNVYPLFWPRTGLRILPILPPQTAHGTTRKAG